MGCKMSRRVRKQKEKEAAIDQAPESIDVDLDKLKRAQLQKLCKRYKLKANGKNTELVSRLKNHFEEIQERHRLSNNNLTSPPSPCEEQGTNSSPPHSPHEEQSTDSSRPHSPPRDATDCASLYDIQLERCMKEKLSQGEQDDTLTNIQRKWCVVEGAYMKREDKTHWREIVLSGGRPVVPNRFGKLIPFMLEPSLTKVPNGVQDNMICGNCVRTNEGFIRMRRQGDDKNLPMQTVSDPLEDLTNTNGGKRERGTQVEGMMGERKAKISRKPSTLTCQEDPDFVKRVEDIMSSAIPGSEEERLLVMKATKSPVQHSPAKV